MSDALPNLGWSIEDSADRRHRAAIALAETGAVFLVFAIHGAWPVPEVNEPHYLGKAIHYWNPTWIPQDFFLDSADTHKLFYFAVGWLSLFLSPTALAWTGRVATWALMAWGWQRLNSAVLRRPWYCVLTAALLVGLIDRFHMAGEWLVGGVEAKGFAWALVFFGLDALLRSRWNLAWLLLGGAAAFHVLVGGWAVVAAGAAWLAAGPRRAPLRTMWPGLVGGLALALVGVVPAIRLTWGVDPAVVREANRIYVFERLAHHLDFLSFDLGFRIRFLALAAATFLLLRTPPRSERLRALQGFFFGALGIAGVGAVMSVVLRGAPDIQAALLRFYWFRLADVVVPATAALAMGYCVADHLRTRRRWGSVWLAVTLVLAVMHLGPLLVLRVQPAVPPAFRVHEDRWRSPQDQLADYVAWREACAWVAHSGAVEPDARFLTPRLNQTFKWYARRSDVVTQKDVPQDAASIVEWWQRMTDIYGTGSDEPGRRWHGSLARRSPAKVVDLARKYGADYLLTDAKPRLPLEIAHRNRRFTIYRLPPQWP